MKAGEKQIFIIGSQSLFPTILKTVAKLKRKLPKKRFSFLSLSPRQLNLIFQRLKQNGKEYKALWLLDSGLSNLTELIKQIRKNLPIKSNNIVILITAADVCRQSGTIILFNQSLQWGSLGVNKIITYPVNLEKIINF